MQNIEKDNPKTIRAWVFYDWAESSVSAGNHIGHLSKLL